MALVAAALLLVVVAGCQQSTKAGTSVRTNSAVRQVSGEEKEFQDAMVEMEGYKSAIATHVRNYDLATSKGKNILDQREAEEAKKEIVRLAGILYTLASKGMENGAIVRQVSSAGSTYREYRDYATQQLGRFRTE